MDAPSQNGPAGPGSLTSTQLISPPQVRAPSSAPLVHSPQTSSTAPDKAAAMVISSAFPPIPGKLIEKIRSGQFVDLKEFLVDNATLLRQTQSTENPSQTPSQHSQTKLREMQDPLSWIFCYLYYLAAATNDPNTRDMAAYGQIVVHLAQKHGGTGWLAYDRLFRLQKAANPQLPWAEICTSLMASTVVIGPGTGQSCSTCSGSDHTPDKCALAPLQSPPPTQTTATQPRNPPPRPSQSPPPAQTPPPLPRPPRKRQQSDDPCLRFNNGTCRGPCRYAHKCLICYVTGHPTYQCPKRAKIDTPNRGQ